MVGECRKQVVTCTIVGPGWRVVATNYCLDAQPRCPREGFASGQRYDMCRDICKQPAHAEVNALHEALDNFGPLFLSQSVAYVEGHTYACDHCVKALAAYGIPIVIGPPPEEAS